MQSGLVARRKNQQLNQNQNFVYLTLDCKLLFYSTLEMHL